MLELEVYISDRAGGALSLSAISNIEGLVFGAAVPGGFADCHFNVPGDARRDILHFMKVSVTYLSSIAWEGRIEDVDYVNGITTVSCFGWRRLLEDKTVRTVIRSTDTSRWAAPGIAYGATVWTGITSAGDGGPGSFKTGQIDPADLTKKGLKYVWGGTTVGAAEGVCIDLYAPGIAFTRINATATIIGAAGSIRFGWSTDGSTWTLGTARTTTGSIAETPANSPNRLRCTAYGNTGGGEGWEVTALRVFATARNEDTTSGVYGGAALADLLALCPGIGVGYLESGSDFAIDELSRFQRDTVLSLVEEIASYYTHDWQVWENARFEWRARVSEGEATIALSQDDLSSYAIDGSIDSSGTDVYLSYIDAATGVEQEATATVTAATNPYVAARETKDLVVPAGFKMTANTAAQLAAQIAAEMARLPVRGTVSIGMDQVVRHIYGPRVACMVRPGDNLLIYDFPGDYQPVSPVRDGRRLFRIISSVTDVESGLTTWELEGPSRSVDAILARLASVTRALTAG